MTYKAFSNSSVFSYVSNTGVTFQAILVFFHVRQLSLSLLQEEETQLPLTKDKDCVKIDNILDLSKYLKQPVYSVFVHNGNS